MIKVKLIIEEKLTYTHEVIVERPDDMDDEEFEATIDELSNKYSDDSADDMIYGIKKEFKIVSQSSGFPERPDWSECEITDTEDVKDETR